MISIFQLSYFYLGITKYSFWVPLYQGGGDVLQWPQGSKLQSSWSIKMSNSCTLCSSSFRPNSPSISHPLSHNGSPLRMEEGGIWSWSTTLPTFQLTSLCSQHSLFSKNRAFPLLYSYSCTLMNVGFIILVCYAQNRYNFKNSITEE